MLIARLLRAIRLDGRLYEELRQDPIAMAQAITVLVLAVLGHMIGWTTLVAFHGLPPGQWIAISLILMPGMWVPPALSLFFLGGLAQVNDPGRGSNRDLTIAAGYSAAPGVLGLLLPIPRATFYVEWIVFVWLMISVVFAAKAILNASLFKAIMYVAPGVVASVILFAWIMASLASPPGGA